MSEMTRIPRNASKKIAAIAAANLKAVKYDSVNFEDVRVIAVTPAEALDTIAKRKHELFALADGSFAAYVGHNVTFRLFPEGHGQQARAEAQEAAAIRAQARRDAAAAQEAFDALFRETAAPAPANIRFTY